MKFNKYVLIIEVLFQRNFDGILLRCINFTKAQIFLQEFHEGTCGGHFAPKTNTHTIIGEGYYWPTIFKESYSMIKKCISYHNFLGKMKKATMSL